MTIPDANFQAVIEEAWLNPNGTPITEVEMFALTELSVPGADIRDLTRLEFTLNLTFLDSRYNYDIRDISSLAGPA